jgi:hypothetical protein
MYLIIADSVFPANPSFQRLGIGTANPAISFPATVPNTLLSAYNSVNPTINIGNSNNATILQLTVATNTTYSTWASAGDSIIRSPSGNLMFQSGIGNAALYVNTTNNVGIGTNNPTNQLTIGTAALPSANAVGTTNFVVNGNLSLYNNRLCFNTVTNSFSDSIYNNNLNLDNEGIFNGFKYNGTTGHMINVTTSNMLSLYINSSGAVGIGTASVTGKCTIYSSTVPSGTIGDLFIQHATNGVSCIVFPNQAQTSYGFISFYDNTTTYNYWAATNTERAALVFGIGITNVTGGQDSIILQPAGNIYAAPNNAINYLTGSVGIGSTNPGSVLDVSGSMYVSAGIYIGGNTTVGIGTKLQLYRGGPSFINHLGYVGVQNKSNVTGISLNVTGDMMVSSVGMGTNPSGAIYAVGVFTFSDQRIKTNIKSVDHILDIILKTNIVSYDYIDQISHSQPHCSAGVIAQQIEKLIPNAVYKSSEYIPNITQNIFSCRSIDDNTIELTVLSELDVNVGDILRYIVYTAKDNATEYKKSISFISDDKKSIHVPAWPNFDPMHRVTLYGTKVDDFLNVDKLMLTMMMAQGVKELSQFSMSLRNRITILSTKLKKINTLITTMNSTITQLENQINISV